MNRLLASASEKYAASSSPCWNNRAVSAAAAARQQHSSSRATTQFLAAASSSSSRRRFYYTKSAHSGDVDGDASDSLIDRLVRERTKFRMMREYANADAVRMGLQTKFGVDVCDRRKQWKAGGEYDEDRKAQSERAKEGGNRAAEYVAYTRRGGGGGELSEEEEAEIMKLMLERYHARKRKDHDAADEIQDALVKNHYVLLDDPSHEWWVDNGEYYAMRGTNELGGETVEYIDSRLRERFAMKNEGRYDEADAVEDELLERFAVSVDDWKKEWSVEPELVTFRETLREMQKVMEAQSY